MAQTYPAVIHHRIASNFLAPSVTVAIGRANEILVNLISFTSFLRKIKINYLHHCRKEQKPARWCLFKKQVPKDLTLPDAFITQMSLPLNHGVTVL